MQFRRRLKPIVDVNMVPMVDVVFQLVCFFMLATTFVQNPGISVLFPGSSTSEPVAMTRLVVTIVSREEVYLNRERYDLDGLSHALARIPTEEKDLVKTVVIEGDRTISYQLMIDVLDVLRKNGFKGANLRTRQVE